MKHLLPKDEDFIIPKGKWYYLCCEQDLTQSDNDEVDSDFTDGYFDTKNEAIIEIKEMYKRSEEYIGKEAVNHSLKTLEKMIE